MMRLRLTLILTLFAVSAAWAQQKTIEDPAEYTSYYAATSTPDNAQRAAALESFLKTYPNSVVKENVLDDLLNTYRGLKNDAMVQDSANRLLEVDPNHLVALALVTYKEYLEGQRTYDLQVLGRAALHAERGLKALETAPMPQNILPQDWLKQRKTYRKIFESAIGMNAFVSRDYPGAEKAVAAVVAEQPDDLPSIFLLAESELEQQPYAPNGLFWGARAVALTRKNGTSGAGADQIQKYVEAKYIQKNGSDAGFEQLVQSASGEAAVPPGFQLAAEEKLPEPPPEPPVVTPSPAPQVAPARALGQKEILDLLNSSVAPQRVAVLVTKFGVSFALTPATEARLRNAGADDKLIQEISHNKR